MPEGPGAENRFKLFTNYGRNHNCHVQQKPRATYLLRATPKIRPLPAMFPNSSFDYVKTTHKIIFCKSYVSK